MGRIDHPLAAPLHLGMNRDDLGAMTNTHLACCDRHRHTLPDQAPRHGITVRVDFDGAFGADDAGQFAQGPERCASRQRREAIDFIAQKPLGASPVVP